MITKIKVSVKKVISLVLALNILGLSAVSANDKVTLNAGTAIMLETTTLLRSEALQAGRAVEFRIKYDVNAEGKVVIPAGTIAQGQIVRTQAAKGLGKPGYVEVRVDNVIAVDGSTIPLAGGNLYQEGEDKQTETILLGVLLCVLFLTTKGKNAEVPAGTQVNATSAGTVYIEVE